MATLSVNVACFVTTIGGDIVEDESHLLAYDVEVFIEESLAFRLAFTENFCRHFVDPTGGISVRPHFVDAVAHKLVPVLLHKCVCSRDRHRLVKCEVAVVGERITRFDRLCTKEHDPINSIVKFAVPCQVGDIIDEADCIEPALGDVPLYSSFFGLVCLINAVRRERTFDEAYRSVKWCLDIVNRVHKTGS